MIFDMFFFFFNDQATTAIYPYLHTLSLHDALPICPMAGMLQIICFVMLGALLCYAAVSDAQRRIIPNWLTLTIAALAVPYWLGTGLELWPDIALQLCLAAGAFVIFAGRSEEHTSELQSLMRTSYAVFCLKKQ